MGSIGPSALSETVSSLIHSVPPHLYRETHESGEVPNPVGTITSMEVRFGDDGISAHNCR